MTGLLNDLESLWLPVQPNNIFLVHREFRDATRVFARFKSHGDWEEFLNGHLSK